ncbi:hypothetical protein M011DRAFT_183046 [Sporormia fimetaria CBS 119925]|uniref:Uncharacterized protein n=1 Tax=Sporormia fimetaria CBS 119925 TaxID=1340428 RepID=A0A6A6VLU4_9PLEO|nr:hypothetical protein M011DRAFT_183046 [Sporormia fimetaria CBS 119925]
MSSVGFPWFSLSAALDTQPQYYHDDLPMQPFMMRRHSGPQEAVTSVLPHSDVSYGARHPPGSGGKEAYIQNSSENSPSLKFRLLRCWCC